MIQDNFIEKSKHAYLLGIGGVGMSSLARILKSRGLEVSGSDMRISKTTEELKLEGIKVYSDQSEIHMANVDLVIYSSAIKADHLGLQVARDRGLMIRHRAEVLSSILNSAETSIAVTGTHGKTTTSSMISFVLSELNRKPTCLVGGDLLNIGTNAIMGNPNLCVAEVDESDRTHELFAPNYAIVTNLEVDHIDHYQRGLIDLEESFLKFVANVRNPGVIISYGEDVLLQKIVKAVGKPNLTYGLQPSFDFAAENIQYSPFGSEFDLLEAGFFTSRIRLGVPGVHNILNALACITVCLQLGLDLEEIASCLPRFRGARRRLEVKWQSDELTVIDDYAHHPTEVKAAIDSLKRMGKRTAIVFQPHRFSRTRYFYREFAQVLALADEVILTDVYGAGECDDGNSGARIIFEEMRRLEFLNVRMIPKSELILSLKTRHFEGDAIAFIGAGDIGEIANEFADRFKTVATA